MLDIYQHDRPGDSQQFRKAGNRFISYAKRMGITLAKFVLNMHTNLGPVYTQHPRWNQLDHLTRALFWQTHSFVLPTILRSYDRYGMANSVEIRMPFLDWRVATFAFALPWNSKIRRGYSKAIIRDAMAPHMPHEIAYRRTKIGFNSPIIDWMRGPLRSFFLDTLNSQSFKQCSLVNPLRACKLVHHVMNERNATFRAGEEAWWSVLPYLWSEAIFHPRRHFSPAGRST